MTKNNLLQKLALASVAGAISVIGFQGSALAVSIWAVDPSNSTGTGQLVNLDPFTGVENQRFTLPDGITPALPTSWCKLYSKIQNPRRWVTAD